MLAYLVDAFTQNQFEGNRAGVVFDADRLTRRQKQQLANEIAASETAFVCMSSTADYRLEYFTPITEIDFCGHATIATFYLLAHLNHILLEPGPQTRTCETKVGTLPITMSRNAGQINITMRQRKPAFAPAKATPSEIAAALSISVEQLDARFPLHVSNTGNWHLMVGVASKQILDTINYDGAALSAILRRHEAATAHVFAHGSGTTYYARNFCPTVGIPEDPATGAAAGAFGAYLANQRLLPSDVASLTILQGEAMGRPSQLEVQIFEKDGEIGFVEVSGTATLSFVLSSSDTSPESTILASAVNTD